MNLSRPASPVGLLWRRFITPPQSRESKTTTVRNIAFLLLVQICMVLYVFCPYYVSPYIFNAVDFSLAKNYSLRLSNATFKQRQLPWLSSRILPRVLTSEEYTSCVRLLSAIDIFFTRYNITYVLFYGSLVGSYVMHDIIPWDDDVDIVVKLDQRLKLENAMEKGLRDLGLDYRLHNAMRATTFKIFFLNSQPAGSREWNWPFIDVAFYGENSSHIWNTNAEGVLPLIVPRDWFYPIIKRPFASHWLPAPRHTSLILRQHYGEFHCKRFAWNHKDEIPWWSTAYAPCEALTDFYPFVWRTPLGPDTVRETLRLGGNELYYVKINESFTGNFEPFKF